MEKLSVSERVLSDKEFALRQQLTLAGIDLALWGKGSARTIRHLATELLNRESILTKEENGQLLREIRVVIVDVKYQDLHSGIEFHLYEDHQEFTDGRQRKRNLGGSLSEKLKPGDENILANIKRACLEELGITDIADDVVQLGSKKEEMRQSGGYPGLNTKYTLYSGVVTLETAQFKPEGYIEHQQDKKTYFRWVQSN